LSVACLLVIAAVGCGGGGGTNDGAAADVPADLASGGAGGAGGGAGAGTAGGAGGTAGSTGGAVGTGGAGGGTAPADCFPECVAALRRSCPRPAFGQGTCVEGAAANGGSAICYSNGVRETRGPIVDGGVTATFTQPDGQTICYVVVVGGSSQSFRTPDGREVAQVVSSSGGWEVICAGSTVVVTVDITDPACRTLNSGDCAIGTCP
jgi:hypothetical protein